MYFRRQTPVAESKRCTSKDRRRHKRHTTAADPAAAKRQDFSALTPCARSTSRHVTLPGRGAAYRKDRSKLQALVYDIPPSATVVFSYAIGTRKLSANERFLFIFVGAQTVVRLLQTTQIISRVCFITDHIAYAISNKTKTV